MDGKGEDCRVRDKAGAELLGPCGPPLRSSRSFSFAREEQKGGGGGDGGRNSVCRRPPAPACFFFLLLFSLFFSFQSPSLNHPSSSSSLEDSSLI